MAESLDFEKNWFACHYQHLYQFAFSLTRDEAESCDLTQETFLYLGQREDISFRDIFKSENLVVYHVCTVNFSDSRRRQTRFPHTELDTAEADLPAITPEPVSRLDLEQSDDQTLSSG